MASPRAAAEARRVVQRLHRVLGEDVRRLREDAAVSQAPLSRASGLDATYLARVEEGVENPTLLTYARLSTALGEDLNAHLYPNTGPQIRDRHQARVVEWLLGEVHPRWSRFPEVAVRRPSRGWIDLVLHDAGAGCLVSTEIESSLGRLEQTMRWSHEKAASLPSWERYADLGPVSTTSSLLIVRATRTTRQIGREVARQLEAAYPAHPDDAIAALTGTRRWPGHALVWVDIRADDIRFLHRR